MVQIQMNTKLQTIFCQQEADDLFALKEDWQSLILQDFQNGCEVLQYVESQSIDVFPDIIQVTPIPVRTGNSFTIRKHTTAIKAYWHSHNFYELIYVIKGSCTQYISMSDVPINISAGGFCIIRPGAVHALEPSGIDDLIIKIRIPGTLFCDVIRFREISQLFLSSKGFTEGILIMPDVTGSKTRQWLQEVIEEYYFGDDYSETALQGYLSLILIDVLRTKHSHPSPFTQIVNDYLERNLCIASLKNFAAYLGYHPTYLSRRINMETGQTFSQLLQKYRLDRATHMLSGSNETVENIAEKLGYKNTSGFYKAFILKYGLPPGEYRSINIVKSVLY